MRSPLLSIVVPTRDRPELLPRAIASALAQEGVSLEVVVVDDGSNPPATVLDQPHVRLVRLDPGRGGAGARNAGLEAARGRFVTFLDDDDELLPGFAARSLEAVHTSTLPRPVAALSGIEVVSETGRLLETRLPPTLPRGRHFALEEPQPGRSFFTKQTLVAPRAVLLAVGGYDPSFRSRVATELFLRLNPVCSLQGIPFAAYRLHRHGGSHVSGDIGLRERSFAQLSARFRDTLEAHPRGHARLLWEHARILRSHGRAGAARRAELHAFRTSPAVALRLLLRRARRQ